MYKHPGGEGKKYVDGLPQKHPGNHLHPIPRNVRQHTWQLRTERSDVRRATSGFIVHIQMSDIYHKVDVRGDSLTIYEVKRGIYEVERNEFVCGRSQQPGMVGDQKCYNKCVGVNLHNKRGEASKEVDCCVH